ncbi:MAG: MBOAT family protein [Deltaproteobacteria bacterium]|nr:MBOAT family protein [Deltaproteobacteria bacterium]
MSHTIDVYKGTAKAPKNILDYLLFVSFFPQLVAGPIMRSRDLLPQIENLKTPKPSDLYFGLQIILWGLFKKVAVADNLSVYVDAVYSNSSMMSSSSLILATYLFAIQIYCDFSGYSDMAVGIGRIFGIKLDWNFNTPYFSQSFNEFWKRWHITLSSWFRDYIYIPLGGSRVALSRHLLNLTITFLISGLWHGAAWNYIFWGFLHSIYLILENLISRLIKSDRKIASIPHRVAKIFIVFNLTTLAWIFFRSQSMSQSFSIIRGIASFKGSILIDNILWISTIPLLILIFIELLKFPLQTDDFFKKISPFTHFLIMSTLTLTILLFGADSGAQFIYFKF